MKPNFKKIGADIENDHYTKYYDPSLIWWG